MNNKKNIIAFIGLIGIHVISYFKVLPLAHNLENQHYSNSPFAFLYVAFVIVFAFFYKHYRENNEKLFRILVITIMLSLIGWAIKYFFLECSICSMTG